MRGHHAHKHNTRARPAFADPSASPSPQRGDPQRGLRSMAITKQSATCNQQHAPTSNRQQASSDMPAMTSNRQQATTTPTTSKKIKQHQATSNEQPTTCTASDNQQRATNKCASHTLQATRSRGTNNKQPTTCKRRLAESDDQQPMDTIQQQSTQHNS